MRGVWWLRVGLMAASAGCGPMGVQGHAEHPRSAGRAVVESFWASRTQGGPAETLLSRYRLPPAGDWPFNSHDFEREDEDDDRTFYSTPRMVHHIDEGARKAWTKHLKGVLAPAAGGEGGTVDVLDLCSSWVSHLPSKGLSGGRQLGRVLGHGMNRVELEKNPALTEIIVQDLNAEPKLAQIPSQSLDAVICTVSVDYLINPQAVMAEVYRVLKPGGKAHFGFSNRFFPTKVIALWRETTDFGRLWMVAAYLGSAGFSVETTQLTTSGKDPYYVASGTKPAEIRADL